MVSKKVCYFNENDRDKYNKHKELGQYRDGLKWTVKCCGTMGRGRQA